MAITGNGYSDMWNIESVTVNLVDDNDDVIATATTSDGTQDVDGDGIIDPAGFYSFEGVFPGDYTVVVTDTNNSTIGLNPTENPNGTSPILTVTDRRHRPRPILATPASRSWATSAT